MHLGQGQSQCNRDKVRLVHLGQGQSQCIWDMDGASASGTRTGTKHLGHQIDPMHLGQGQTRPKF